MAVCARCGNDNPPGFRFCGFCAAPLLPEPGTQGEERKVVTVLFADLVGFTASSEAADPEDVRARLRTYHEHVRAVLERHGGLVEKFVGDAVMAVFGAPVAHEDDAERAVRAGLRIVEVIGELSERDPALQLQVRVGVNTGEALVSLVPRVDLGEGVVAGDMVNTAARVQTAAPPGAVAVSRRTHDLTERVFEYEPLAPVAAKGKAQALELWRARAPRARLGPDLTRSFATPLVGRQLERTLLTSIFERAAAQRLFQLVTIVGEPGIGKSRLVGELFGYLSERPGLVRWRQGRCLPYGDGIAFWALGEIVKAEAGILESDSPSEAAAKLDRALPAALEDRGWLATRLAPLVGVPGEPAAKGESFSAWRRFLELLALDSPAVLVVEDLHWGDDAMLEFLEHLAEECHDVPLIVVCTARPELYERWPAFGGGARNASRINLAPLTDDETVELLTLLAGRARVPAELEALRDLVEGNPLFAEELVGLLADRTTPTDAHAPGLPGSLQALIAARLDTLGAARKSLLQDASVVGKVFWTGALAAMGGRDRGDVERELRELVRKELVRPLRSSSVPGQQEYSFWHALIRDVCYGQIPRRARATKHEQAAGWLRELTGERDDDVADVLAHHYGTALELRTAAGDDHVAPLADRTIHYLALAAQRALPLDAAAAATRVERALALAPDGHPERARLLERSADVARHQNRLEDARDALEESVSLHRHAGDPYGVGRALSALALVLHPLGDLSRTRLIDEAIRVLEAEPPSAELVTAYCRLASDRNVASEHELALAAAERALELAERLGLDESARALGYRGEARAQLGDRGGIDDLRRACERAVERGETYRAAAFSNNLAGVVWAYDGPQRALEVGREGLAFCEQRGITAMAFAIAGQNVQFLAEAGRTAEALEAARAAADRIGTFDRVDLEVEPFCAELRLRIRRGELDGARVEQAVRLADRIRAKGEAQLVAIVLPSAAEAAVAAGRLEDVRRLLEEAARTRVIRRDRYYAALLPAATRAACRLGDVALAERLLDGTEVVTPIAQHAVAHARAAIAAASGRMREAAALYAEAAERWDRFETPPERAYALLGQGRCLRALGEPEAEEVLRESREGFEQLTYVALVAEVDGLLAQTSVAPAG
ncbi:MAG TPA: adenylate/guanylate cyclase domain-containing protein [Gaiellaceae bacterium]|nr:adenylate/guanylate cyclase domain-containing protein [Gaiellaceae bacterium]